MPPSLCDRSYEFSNIASFDGRVVEPVALVNGTIYSIQCPDRETLILGGRFWNVNGASVKNLAVLKTLTSSAGRAATTTTSWSRQRPGGDGSSSGFYGSRHSKWILVAAPRFSSTNETTNTSTAPRGGMKHPALVPATRASDDAGAREPSMILVIAALVYIY